MARNRRLKPGSVCITVNTRHPALNDGMLVVVISTDFVGHPANPYWIKRVDGQPLGSVTRADGGHNFFKRTEAWCCRRKLKPVDGGTDPRDALTTAKRPAVAA